MSNYDDASLIMFPSGYKEDKIYSLKPTDGSGDLTFTRASSATRVNAEGLIETASILGSELVTNGDFATDTSWTKSANTTISGGQAIFTANGVTQSLIQFNAWTADSLSGKKVQLTYTIISNSLNAGDFRIGGITGASAFNLTSLTASVGTYTVILDVRTSAGTDNAIDFFITPTATSGTLVIDNVSIKEVITNNVPRIDYTGGGCGKLLLEPQRTNLVKYSEQFDDALWQPASTTVSANQATSPDGTQNADLIYPTLSSSNLGVYQNTTGVTGVVGTVSCYVKSAGKNWALLGTDNTSTYNVSFDLVNGVVGSVPTGYTATIESVGNGWYRITATFQSGSSLSYPFVGVADNTNRSVTADGTNGLYIWGFQTEIASYATSYIPTIASSVTRLADTASKTGISSLIGQTEGTIFADINNKLVNPLLDTRIQLSDGSANNWIFLGVPDGSSGGLVRCYIVNVATSFNVSFYSSSALAQQRYKIAFAYKSGSIALYINGVLEGSSSATGTMPSCSALAIGGQTPTSITQKSTQQFNEVILFPTRLTNTQLAELTTL